MNIDAVIAEITTIRDSLSPIIEPSSLRTLAAALADLHSQKSRARQQPRKAKRSPWTLVIPPDNPLAFQSTKREPLIKHELEIDLACSLSEPDRHGIPLGEHNISVRVWSTDPGLCFRDELDAQCLRIPLQERGRRVMLRFHFDLANRDQEGPKYHLQIGGKGAPTDYHWLPDNWKLPRFLHVPVNLALVCEFVARTFYPSKFSKLSQEPAWIHAVRAAEETYLYPFLCSLPYVTINPRLRKDSLLSSVWNG